MARNGRFRKRRVQVKPDNTSTAITDEITGHAGLRDTHAAHGGACRVGEGGGRRLC